MDIHWYYDQRGRQLGPITFAQLQHLVSSGRVQAGDLVMNATNRQWVAARTVAGLPFAHLPPQHPEPRGAPSEVSTVCAAPLPESVDRQSLLSWSLAIMASVTALGVVAFLVILLLRGPAKLVVAEAAPRQASKATTLERDISLEEEEATSRDATLEEPKSRVAGSELPGPAPARMKMDAEEITSRFKPWVVFVQTDFVAEESSAAGRSEVAKGSVGSGLIISNDTETGLILTNKHVIDPVFAGGAADYASLKALAIKVSAADESVWHKATIAAIHETLDLALVLVDRRFVQSSALTVIGHGAIRQGEAVVALGNPLGVEFVTTEGIISKVADDKILTSCPINHGNSGGPLILARGGLIAGINTSKINSNNPNDPIQNFNFATCADRIKLDGATCWHWINREDATRRLMGEILLEE